MQLCKMKAGVLTPWSRRCQGVTINNRYHGEQVVYSAWLITQQERLHRVAVWLSVSDAFTSSVGTGTHLKEDVHHRWAHLPGKPLSHF